MAETKQEHKMERTYVIPLRKEWQNVPSYKRARRSVIAIKEFIAKHMKVIDRDLDKVKVDIYLNNEVWFRGSSNPPIRIKVKAIRDGENVRVELVDAHVGHKFSKIRQEKIHRKAEKRAIEEKKEEKEEKSEEQKKEETEKEKSAAITKEHLAEQQARALKHTTKIKVPRINRMALKK